MVNEFSNDWYALFLNNIAENHTRGELALLKDYFPLQDFSNVLDLCCGPGRHARHLVASGYQVTGIDSHAPSIQRAKESFGDSARFLIMDMRALNAFTQTFDSVLSLWHSFGYFDEQTNTEILRSVYNRLRPGGRFLIDIYNRNCLKEQPTSMTTQRRGIQVRTQRTWMGKRLRVELDYEPGEGDTFEWHLYTPEEFLELAESLGFRLVISCALFKPEHQPSKKYARMQFVLERPGV